MFDALLPPNRTPLESSLAKVLCRSVDAAPVRALWDPLACPLSVLPWLAWSLSVDEWDDAWSEDRKRAVIADSILLHRQKGTPAAIRRALASVGQPDAEIIERADYIVRNGTVLRDGLHRRRGTAGWATYRVVLKRPVTVDQAYQIKRILLASQRAGVHLVAINYPQAAFRRNGSITRNGSYTRGVVNTQI